MPDRGAGREGDETTALMVGFVIGSFLREFGPLTITHAGPEGLVEMQLPSGRKVTIRIEVAPHA